MKKITKRIVTNQIHSKTEISCSGMGNGEWVYWQTMELERITFIVLHFPLPAYFFPFTHWNCIENH